ncbi:hypothetical protein [Rhodanobacter sp. C06]|uniref:hypothetical protein n=1 Tax=Rhodanobacter sp. C06 TaxID=1945854 RepID=UPI001115948C|nr:hypothetical protein [Rhodanobacter sp. C06]
MPKDTRHDAAGTPRPVRGFGMMAPSMQSPDAMSQRLDHRIVCAALLLAVAASLARFLLEAHLGFNLWDEGYLWYGVQRVLHGEVPIRDFMSYDLGRYYWAAGVLWLFDVHGIVAVRAATELFSTLGVVAAAWLVLRGSNGNGLMRLGLCAVAVVLCLLWMVPWWKGYDAAISIILVASLARVLTSPSPVRFLVHGVVIGVAAVFGKNHGFYGVVACLLATPALMLRVAPPAWRRCIPAWLAGVTVGFSPILLGLVLDHQFAVMFWESIRFLLFEYHGTNLPLPVPWPWTVHGDGALTQALLARWVTGGMFLLLPLFCVIGMAVVAHRLRRHGRIVHPEFVACVATAIPYLNVAFSRADASHLAQAIFPLLIGVLILPARGLGQALLRWLGFPLLALASLLVALPLHPWYQARTQPGWRVVDVRGDALRMSDAAAVPVEAVESLAHRYVPSGGTLLAAPVWPGAYALLGIRSPVWEIYPLFPRSDSFQRQEIGRLQQARPSLVLVYDIGVDGREDLRYAHTHPVIWSYVQTNYRQLESPRELPELRVYIPKLSTE